VLSPDLLGWTAAALMVATFGCREARLMRPLAVATNVAFIGYGALAALPPVLALHLLLLPVNLWRWAQVAGTPARLTRARAWLAARAARCAPPRQPGVGMTLLRGTTLCVAVLLLSA
jgi:hypothetical protein